MNEAEVCWIRGAQIALISQDPALALNPVIRVGDQVAEVIRGHAFTSAQERRTRVGNLLREAGFDQPDHVYSAYPHQLSGGQRQRVAIAQAIACNPALSALAISQPVLWPPSGKLVTEKLSYQVTTTCDANPALTVSVTSNQPVNSLGTSPDWVVLDPHHVQLRAEQDEATRIYTVTVKATDSALSSSASSVSVKVPLNH